MREFMVELDIPKMLPNSFVDLVPVQRETVVELLEDNKITSYTLAVDRSKLWIIVNAAHKTEVMDILDLLPLTKFLTYQIFELMFHNKQDVDIPQPSLN